MITNFQLKQIRVIANAKGITKKEFQFGIDSGFFDSVFSELKEKFVIGGLLPPKDGRIYFLSDILVREDEKWTKAISEGGPDTPKRDPIWQIGHLYPPSGSGDVKKDFIFVCHSRWHLENFLAWGEKNKLRRTTARDVFAIGRERPHLNRELQMNPMRIYATDPQNFKDSSILPLISWQGTLLKAGYVCSRCIGARGWFLFSLK